MPIRILKKDKTKTIPVSHSKDHPDVKTAEKNIKKDREKAKEDFPILSKVFGTGNPKKDTEKAKRVADTLQTMASEIRTKTEGSFKKGGLSAGQKKIAAKAPPPDKIDAKDFAVLKKEKAKGRGMGLQDESIKPGKVMKAKRGHFSESNVSGHKRVMGVFPKVSGAPKNLNKAFMKTIGVLPTIDKVTPTVKGKQLPVAKNILNAAKATRYGKIALGIAGAALGAKELLKSKMKKEDKKMGGGMAKKYSVGGGADMGDPKKPTAVPRRRNFVGQKLDKARRYAGTPGYLPKPAIGKMGGGMMNKPMGYKDGTKPGAGPLGGAGPRGLGALGAAGRRKGKEDSSVTLAKFMKAKIDSTNESIKGGGMKADRVTEGSGYRNKRGFRKDVEEGKYKQEKDADYYKSIGLTGKRGDQAVDDFFKPYHMRSDAIKLKSGGMTKPMGYKSGTMVKARGCKLGRTRPTKMY